MYSLVFASLLVLAKSAAPYHAYIASLTQLDSSGVSGEVTVFVTQSGLIGIGSASGLEANLIASPSGSDCTAPNGCGTHIHAGSACTDTTTQGGHYYDMTGSDPWGIVQYGSTSSGGSASFTLELTTSTKDIDGKPFIVHNNAGVRVACGILSYAATQSAELMALSSSGVTGGVTVYTSSSMIVAAGWANGLEASLADSTKGGSDCVATNGCGSHIHSGTSCDQYDQGGHLQNSTGYDPWSNIRYSSTNPEGHATFVFSVQSDRTDVLGKPFILHNNRGGRVSCGLLTSALITTYSTNISQLDNSGVSGEITVFVTQRGLIGIGTAQGLEANLMASPSGSNCTAPNGCGTHIHAGSACTDTTTQGGHYYDMTASDPWGIVQYGSTSSGGSASFTFELTTRAKDIDGKPFIVHNNAGVRVACGILSRVVTQSAELMPLSSSGVTGSVTVYASSSMMVAAGWASGLEASLADSTKGGSDCVATNGCGTHVHSGNSCDQAGQGGHLQTSTGQDPWTSIRYSSTNAEGYTTFVFSVQTDRTDVMGKPFILHNNSGGRVSCGLLSSVATTTTTTFTASHGAYDSYIASLSQLDNSGVSGEVTIFVTRTGLIGIGSAQGLEPNLIASPVGSNCTAANACGTHIHGGVACTDITTQGSHDYDNAGSDPWRVIKFGSTDSVGFASFTFELITSATIIDGKPFMLHDNNGGRVACGILSQVVTHSAGMTPLSGSGVTGGVTIYASSSMIVAAGWASGLEASLADSTEGGSDCVAANGCGTHVHSGSSCDQAGQGGHLQTSTGQDPWANVRYSSTNAEGYATFAFSVQSDRTDVLGKPFILHNNAGGRVSCGLLSPDATTTTLLDATTTMTTTGVATPTTVGENTSASTTLAQGTISIAAQTTIALPLAAVMFLVLLP